MYKLGGIPIRSLFYLPRRSYSSLFHSTSYYFAVNNAAKSYNKVYKVSGEGTFVNKEPKFVFKGDKTPANQQVYAPLEQLLGSLCACEYSTALFVARSEFKINVNKIIFKNVEGHIDTSAFFGKADQNQNKFSKIKMEIEIDADATQEEIERLRDESHKRCPVFNMMLLAGVKIEAEWKKIQNFF